MDNNYLAQRLATLGVNASDKSVQRELEALKAENAQLKQQLEQTPPANFKGETQVLFEQSPEFEQLLNAFYMRFVRDKFGLEFRNSPYIQEFQAVANKAFEQFEAAHKKEKEAPKNARSSKRAAGDGEADNK